MKRTNVATAVLLSLVAVSVSAQERAGPDGFAGIKISSYSGGTATFEISSFQGSRLSVEIRRGPETPLELRHADPLTPPYEFDIRILDTERFPIFSQFGGHAPLDPAWVGDYENLAAAARSRQAQEATPGNFILSARGLADLKSVEFDASLAPEIDALKRLVPTLIDLSKTEATESREAPGDTAVVSYKNKIAIHDVALWYAFGLGRHSATLLKNINSSGTVLSGWSACNHGRCPSEMNQKCSWTSSLSRPKLTQAPLCSTPYSAFSSSGKHNCNDDTEIQYAGVRNAYTPSPTAGKCSDSARNDTPDSCF